MRLSLLALSLSLAGNLFAGVIVESVTLKSNGESASIVYSPDTGIAFDTGEGDVDNYIATFASNLTYTVGSGGDFETLNEALLFASKRYPSYASGRSQITLQLLSGFVLAEQVDVRDLDLLHVLIQATDATVTVTRSAMTKVLLGLYPAFYFENARAPRFGAGVYEFDSSGSPTGVCGVVAAGSYVRMTSTGGFRSAPRYGLYALNGSVVYCADGYDFTGCGENSGAAIVTDYGAYVRANSAKLSNSRIGIQCQRNSQVSAVSVVATNCSLYGIYSVNQGTVFADAGNVSGAGTYGLFLNSNSRVNFYLGNASYCNGTGSTDGVKLQGGSILVAYGINASYAGRYGVFMDSGAILHAQAGNFSNAGSSGLLANGSTVYAPSATATNCAVFGVQLGNAANATLTSCNFSNSGSDNVRVLFGSDADLSSSIATNSARYGILVSSASRANCYQANFSGAASSGVYSDRGSTVDAAEAKARKVAGVSGTGDFVVAGGGLINLSGTSEGGVSQTKNTLTAAGIIFQP